MTTKAKKAIKELLEAISSNSKAKIDEAEKILVKNIRKISKESDFYKLPIGNIVSIVSKIDFAYECNVVKILQRIIENTTKNYPNESILLLPFIKENYLESLQIDECMTLLKSFTSCPLCLKLNQLFEYEKSLLKRDIEYEKAYDEEKMKKEEQRRKENIKIFELPNPFKFYSLNSLPDDYEEDIFKAIEMAKLTSIRWNIEKRGYDVNMKDDMGRSLLHLAARQGFLDIVQYLISKGADISIRNKTMNTPLHWAIRYGQIHAVQFLVEHGADIHAKQREGCTPLDYACYFNQPLILEYLFQNGCESDLSSKSNFGETPFHSACSQGSIEAVKFLLQHNCKQYIFHKTNSGDTPLHVAAMNGFTHVVSLLLDYGAKFNERNNNGETPLFLACEKSSPLPLIENLVKHGADVNIPDNENRSPLREVCYPGDIEVIKLLVENGANINCSDNEGWSVFHVACLSGQINIVKYLVEHGANVNARDLENATPLHFACEIGNVEVLAYLLGHGAKKDINVKYGTNHETPLAITIKNYNEEAANFIKKNGGQL